MKQCKLIIRDEVNVKIEGLELAERKALMKMFEFEIPGARFLPSVRLGRWNGKTSYFSLGGSTYINLLSEILPALDRAGYDIELDDTRDYQTTFEFNEVTEETFKHKMWPTGHPIEGQPIVLRDYQIEIINNYLKNPQAPITPEEPAKKEEIEENDRVLAANDILLLRYDVVGWETVLTEANNDILSGMRSIDSGSREYNDFKMLSDKLIVNVKNINEKFALLNRSTTLYSSSNLSCFAAIRNNSTFFIIRCIKIYLIVMCRIYF